MATDAIVYIVDDDTGVRDALGWLLRTRRLASESFASAEAFLAADLPLLRTPVQPAVACLLLDVRMPGMSGLALFEQLVARGAVESMPVIFLTGHADVPTAVHAVKHGAFDFCEKPFSNNMLVDRVEAALERSRQAIEARQMREGLAARLTRLTVRERAVMHLVAEGLPNKRIADQLGVSVRTVEVHRARVFDKMAVRSAVELIQELRKR